jgi:Glycosyltransferase family 10 (fucosyltransferase) C-term
LTDCAFCDVGGGVVYKKRVRDWLSVPPPCVVYTSMTSSPLRVSLALSLHQYMGTSTVDHYLPGDHSIVRVTDFASPRHLATYLSRVANDEREYAAYHDWRESSVLPAGFLELLRQSLNTLPCRVCEQVDESLRGSRTPHAAHL